ncbi:TolC family protein, partial [Flavobacteriaceae bacterium]|nr:TolC family protein [Flavobacteriaceae bacterium]
MTTNLKLLFLFTLNFYFVVGQELPKQVSLEQAVAFGKDNNRQILNANREVQRAYKERWSTIAIGLPQVRANASYQNFIELPTSLIPAQFFGGKEGEFAEVQFGTPQTVVAGVTLDQLIFDGSYLVGLEATKVYLAISENILEKTMLEIRKSIISTYSSILLVQENIKFLKKNRNSLEANLNEVRELFRNGFEEEESVEQLRLTLSGIETQLRYAQNTEKITFNMLKLLMGYPTTTPLTLTDTLETLTTEGLFEEKFDTNPNLSGNIDIKIAT